MSVNDGDVRGLALDMYFDQWDLMEEELNAQFDQEIEKAISEVRIYKEKREFLYS